jgi:tetratricopeptide (TPR) repeat protein/tRNA A-37 threonylcarbamoyl transferase component Bud32
LATLSHFGDYELLEEIARGGMGVVYKARQISLNRIVAVKTILAGQLARADGVARFHVEAEAAAHLQHPNIVAIHEVGEHDGHHYFSMDFVEGRNLTALVRDGPLPVRRSAALVRTIAEAIHFAHERGVLHRDLKPSNVLVDSNEQPRVTDFGLAKRLDVKRDAGVSDLTLTGQVLGTPSYMPPEQAFGGQAGLGYSSDVYSMGGVLFFLLTGRAPFVAETIEETLQMVLGRDPLSPRLFNPGVPRDLETICLNCLEKEPGRRYATARALAEDLGRFLNHEPILARAPNAFYRAWKFVRRHRVGVSASAAFAALLLGSTIISAVLERDARLAEQRAEAVLNFLREHVLAAARPEGQVGGLGHDVTLLAALRAAEPAIPRAFSNQPLAEATLRIELGRSYLYLGQYSNAIHQTERARALREFHLGPKSAETLEAMHILAMDYRAAGSNQLALRLNQQVFELRKTRLGLKDPATVRTLDNLANSYRSVGSNDLALQLHQQIVELRTATLGPDNPATLVSMNNLANSLRDAGRVPEAIRLRERVLPLWRKRQPDHPDTLVAMHNLAIDYLNAGHVDQALPLFQETARRQKAKLGLFNPQTLFTIRNLALACAANGDFAGAEQAWRDWTTGFKPSSPNDSLILADALQHLGAALLSLEKSADATPFLRDALDLWQKSQPKSSQTFEVQGLLALSQGKYADAEKHLLAARAGLAQRQKQQPKPERLLRIDEVTRALVQLYEAWSQPQKAAHWRTQIQESRTR